LGIEIMGSPKKQKKQQEFKNRPFQDLKKILKANTPENRSPLHVPAAPQKKTVDVECDDEALLDKAMKNVTPLTSSPPLAPKKANPRPMLQEADDELLVLKALDDLVHGVGEFNFADTDEYIEASVVDLDRRILKKMRRGEYSYQAHLDLHGLNRKEARASVGEFIKKCSLESKKCVLIVHGRGLGSKDNIPIIKNKLASWLTRGFIGKRVLAYTSAKPYDGGTGAVYVLLRTPNSGKSSG
jgi:DNA-nicking Smr family endonuclease